MKPILAPLVLLAALLASCSRSPDRSAPGQLAGTWEMSSWRTNHHLLTRTRIAADGSYLARLTYTFPNGDIKDYVEEGKYEIQDGFVVKTVTKDYDLSTPVPYRMKGRIVSFDAHELRLVSVTQNSEGKGVRLRKVQP